MESEQVKRHYTGLKYNIKIIIKGRLLNSQQSLSFNYLYMTKLETGKDDIMQSSYELVKKAIEFDGPERIPYNFDENRTPEIDKKYGEDFIWVFVDQAPDFEPELTGQNELGVISRAQNEKVMGLPKEHPLADWRELETYQLPDYTLQERYINMEERIKKNSDDKYVLGMFPHCLFQVMLELLGFENLMVSVMDKKEMVLKLRDMLVESCIAVINEMANRGVNGIIAIEDLGLQDRLMISPKKWREIFKPGYARIIQAAHNRGLHIFSHSCGYIIDIIEDFIEVGLDVIQIDQQDNMGIDNLSERYGGKICFFCPVDIQTTLRVPENEQEVEEKAKKLIEAFGSYNGGFMAKTYPQPESIDIPERNVEVMCKTFKAYGKYPLEL